MDGPRLVFDTLRDKELAMHKSVYTLFLNNAQKNALRGSHDRGTGRGWIKVLHLLRDLLLINSRVKLFL